MLLKKETFLKQTVSVYLATHLSVIYNQRRKVVENVSQ